jgi:hypothetical protein
MPFVRIIKQTFVGGKPAFPGEVLEVSETDANNLIPNKGTAATAGEFKAATAKAAPTGGGK